MGKLKSRGASFEVFQVFDKFHWFVKDEDGNVIDGWNDSLTYDDALERVVGSRAFNSEAEAREYFKAEHPAAVDFHKFAKEG